MQDYTLVRQGLPPLKFNGEIIGAGEIGDQQAGLTVRIYRTKGNRYIAEIERRNLDRRNRQDPFGEQISYRNAVHYPTPSEIIEWLKEGEDSLGKASQVAVEMACGKDSGFTAAWVETVE